MLKRQMVSVLSLALGIFIGCQDSTVNKNNITLSKNENVHQRDHDLNEARTSWYEDMHRVPKNVDWRDINKKYLKEKKSRFIHNANDASVGYYAQAEVGQPSPAPESADNTIEVDDALAESAESAGIHGVWSEIGANNLAGRIVVVDYDPANDKVYAVSDGGNLWKGSLNGNDWESLNDQFRFSGVSAIHIVPHNGVNRLVVAAKKYNYYSDDEGKTWTISEGLSNVIAWGSFAQSVITSRDEIFLLSREWEGGGATVLFRSLDKGESYQKVWSRSTDKINNFDLFTDKGESNGALYMMDHNEFYVWSGTEFILRSTIDFSRFESISDNLQNVFITKSGSTAYLAAHSEFNGKHHSYIFRSTDNGGAWSFQSLVNEKPWSKKSFKMSQVNANELILGAVSTFKSIDAGVTWELKYDWHDYKDVSRETRLHADVPQIRSFFKSGQEFFLICTDGGVYVSYDRGENVRNISLRNLNTAQYYSTYTNPNDPNIVYAASQDQAFQRTMNAGTGAPVEFDQFGTGDIGHAVSGDDGKTVWVVLPGTVQRYPDAGNPNSAEVVSKGFDLSSMGIRGQRWMHPIFPHPHDPDNVILGGGGQNGEVHLYKVFDNGDDKLHAAEIPYDFRDGDDDTYISAFAFSPVNKDIWYVMKNNGKLFVSSNAGGDWTISDATGPTDHFFYGAKILADPIDPDKVYFAGSGFAGSPVYVSNDRGATLTELNNGIPNSLVHDLDITPDGKYLVAASEVGAYIMDTELGEWYDLNGPAQDYWSVEYVEAIHTFRFATFGRGIWDFKLDLGPKYYHIVHKPTNLRLQSCSSTTGDLVKVKDSGSKWHCAQWQLVRNGEYFHIQNRHTNMFLKPLANSNSSDIELAPSSWNGSWTQWSYADTQDGFGYIKNKATDKFLFLSSDNVVQQQPNTWTGDWTRWELLPVEESN